ncbi:hypothetical protein CEXT_90151 [Caerostris extrusa]|uniref:Uncharacterized protein n=1 Tax=Caerostris extrusa TaxID=172846 RepID=A0AAV4UW68_CAEEX|nr:hypothetical protein CEXT_90151 [Caerostris extrusa]
MSLHLRPHDFFSRGVTLLQMHKHLNPVTHASCLFTLPAFGFFCDSADCRAICKQGRPSRGCKNRAQMTSKNNGRAETTVIGWDFAMSGVEMKP